MITAGAVLLVLGAVPGVFSGPDAAQGVLLSGLGLVFWGGVQLFFLLRQYCCPPPPVHARNAYVANPGAFRPQQPDERRHGEPLPNVWDGYSYGSYQPRAPGVPAPPAPPPYLQPYAPAPPPRL